MLNKVQIIGRLGQDPEVVSENVTRISVATSESWTDKSSGEKREKTEWHRVTFFGKLAEVSQKYLHKGSLVYVEGSLETSKYEKEGVTKYSTSIKAQVLRMLDGKPAATESGHASESRSGGASSSRTTPTDDDDWNEDVPF